jgi:hypothetical protein
MLKFAATTATVRWNDRLYRIAEGDPWYSDDPFVRARPELFTDAPQRVFGDRPVEQATAAPGERRTVKRA